MDHLEIYVSNLKTSYVFYNWLLPQLGFASYQNWALDFPFEKGLLPGFRPNSS